MSTKTRAPRSDPTATRAEVLRAAERCIQRHGIVKTTMDDIAREAGMYRPSVYRYFADREALLLAIMTKHSLALTRKAHRFIEEQGSFAEQLVQGLLFIAEHGHRDEFTRYLLAREDTDLRRVLRSTDAFAVLAGEFWD